MNGMNRESLKREYNFDDDAGNFDSQDPNYRGFTDYSNIKLKPDHEKRPLWILPNNHIFFETFSPLYRYAYEFLIAISEPLSRPNLIHEYTITQYSLYAAMVLQLTPDSIKSLLLKLAKNEELPIEVSNFIDKNTQKFGSAKVFLKSSNYYLELFDNTLLDSMPELHDKLVIIEEKVIKGFSNPIFVDMSNRIETIINSENIDEQLESLQENEIEIEPKEVLKSKIYLIQKNHLVVTKAFIDRNIPLIEEYDLKMKDDENPDLSIELKPSTKIRPYQEKALSKVFIGGKARSGVIVLPCGAGKTLVGIAAAAAIKKRVMIFCNTNLAIEQWKNQFKLFTDINEDLIVRLSSKHMDEEKYKRHKNEAFIAITTYSMVSKETLASEALTEKTAFKRQMLAEMKQLQWGICILDEVQVVPAKTFQRVLIQIKSHCKLGLTATLIREDDKIENLNYMIGPKLYEEAWMDLVNNGYLARPYCVEVRCEMTKEFMSAYTRETNRELKNLLYSGNPNKFLILQFLIKRHEERGDKVIVFGDKPFLLKHYACMLKYPVAHGKVSHEERVVILNHFQRTKKINVIFLSSIGDTAIDLPAANVVIQISSHFGSRKQEAQRLGRILRPKLNEYGEFNAFFYTLVSSETDESLYAAKRQKFLIDQGFHFEIINEPLYKTDERIFKRMFMTDLNSQQDHLTNLIRHANKASNEVYSSSTEDNGEESEEEEVEERKVDFGNNAMLLE